MSVPYRTGPLAAPHGFFSRHGGVSTGDFATLNCARNGDDPANVTANRRRALSAIGATRLETVRQVHGIAVVTMGEAPATGDADALVTAHSGVTLGIVTADCAPVLFAARSGRIVAAAHAGWRGAAAGVLEATVAAMRHLGAHDVTAVIGPCIQAASYETGPDFLAAILDATPDAARFFAPGRGDRRLFDLPGYCAHRLAALGVPCASLGTDTRADDAYFSNRRRTLATAADDVPRALGHQISMITCA